VSKRRQEKRQKTVKERQEKRQITIKGRIRQAFEGKRL
jgi:hypothetical protein